MTNDACVKYSMEPQTYKFVNTHAHEVSGWKILSRLIHLCTPHLGWMSGDFQSDLVTLAFKNIEQLEDFCRRIIILQQEIIIYGETVSPTRILFQYMNSFSNSEKLKALTVPNITYLIVFLDTLNLSLNLFQIQKPLWSNQLMMMKLTISWNYSTQNMMMIFLILTFRRFRFDWGSPLLQNFIQSIMCFQMNIEEQMLLSQILISHFSMFVPTKSTVELSNGNTGHSQIIGIFLCFSPNCTIIYSVGPVSYFPCHPYNTILSGALKLYVGFQKVTSESL